MTESTERPLFAADATPRTDQEYDTANLTGRQIGRYLIGRRLGSGGAAAVYQSYDQVQGRSVALKVLLPGADEIVRTRFRQEARTAAALRHPNIVTTVQVGDAPADGVAYIAMELIEGESLARLLERRGKLLPEESCNHLTPIARALAYAHRAGVVHRDVKPSNILLRPASPGAPGSVQLEALDHPVVPLLSDFGIARALDTPELTNAGRTIGTPAYMAPEQCAGSRDVTAQSDIYSLGAVLYRCLVGRAPFLGSTTQILYAHVYESVTIPDDILAALPPRVVDVLRATLAKEPTERYISALELADALTLAAGRALPTIQTDDAEIVETTSTLTLSSLSAVGPATQLQRTETVIVSSPPPATRSQNIVLPQPAGPLISTPTARPIGAQRPVNPPAPPPRPWMRFAAGAAGVVALILMGIVLISAGSIFPFQRLFGTDPEITGTNQPLVLLPTSTPNAVALVATATPGVNQETPPPTNTEPPAAEGTAVPVVVAPEATPTATATSMSIATPEPTQTPVIPPTATPLPEPTFTPTPAEPEASATITPTPIQPEASATATPTPTPDGLTLACQYVAVEELYSYLLQEGRAQALGCATDQGRPIDFEVQPFQNGLMLRRDDIRAIYVYFAGNSQWEQHPDRWTPEMPPLAADPELAPPSPGLVQPERGIGLLWAENNVLRGTLGWATAPATATKGVVQTFDGGLLIRDMQAGGEVIYEFLKSLFRF